MICLWIASFWWVESVIVNAKLTVSLLPKLFSTLQKDSNKNLAINIWDYTVYYVIESFSLSNPNSEIKESWIDSTETKIELRMAGHCNKATNGYVHIHKYIYIYSLT